MTTWPTIIDDVQEYLAKGVAVLPAVYSSYLEALSEGERAHNLCMVPFSRFELYHHRLERKVRTRLRLSKRAA